MSVLGRMKYISEKICVLKISVVPSTPVLLNRNIVQATYASEAPMKQEQAFFKYWDLQFYYKILTTESST